MLLIIIGLVLIMLDIAIAPENTAMVIELLPDFVGYALVVLGLRKLRDGSKTAVVALSGTVTSAVLYAMKALGFAAGASMTILLLEVFELVLMLVLLFAVVRRIREQEREMDRNLQGKLLVALWLCYTLTIAVSYIFQTVTAVGSLAALLADLLGIVILYLLFTAGQTIRENAQEE